MWYFRGFKYAGVDKETGKALYYDKNGEITDAPKDDDKQDLGSAIPKFTYGITINLEYKGFDFTVFGTGAAGNKIYNLMVSADRPRINGIDTYWKDSWKQKGDNAKYPDMKVVSTDWTFFSSSAAIFNGSYFKFKQIGGLYPAVKVDPQGSDQAHCASRFLSTTSSRSPAIPVPIPRLRRLTAVLPAASITETILPQRRWYSVSISHSKD